MSVAIPQYIEVTMINIQPCIHIRLQHKSILTSKLQKSFKTIYTVYEKCLCVIKFSTTLHYHELGKMHCTKNIAYMIVVKLHLPINSEDIKSPYCNIQKSMNLLNLCAKNQKNVQRCFKMLQILALIRKDFLQFRVKRYKTFRILISNMTKDKESKIISLRIFLSNPVESS